MQRRTPRTYDEIVRRTVVDPDSSFRPPTELERQAMEGPYIDLDEDERAILLKVVEIARELDAPELDIEVARSRVTLRGHVPTARLARLLDERVARIEGVDEVVDRLVIQERPTA